MLYAEIVDTHVCNAYLCQVINQLHKVDFLSRVMEVLSNVKTSLTGLDSNAVVSVTCKLHTYSV